MNYDHPYFKAPCKLVFTHPETEHTHAGTVELPISDEYVRPLLEVLWSGRPDDAPGTIRAQYIHSFLMPKMRDENGEVVDYQMVIRRPSR